MPTVLPELDERRNMNSDISNRNGHFSNTRNFGSSFGRGRNQGPRGTKRYSRDDDSQWNNHKKAKFGTSY